jgi:hypothetical protein
MQLLCICRAGFEPTAPAARRFLLSGPFFGRRNGCGTYRLTKLLATYRLETRLSDTCPEKDVCRRR